MNKKRTMHRRLFLQQASLAGFSIALSQCSPSTGNRITSPGIYDSLNTEKYLSEVTVETRITDEKIFTEGPAVDRDGNVYLTNIPVSKILKWDPKQKNLSLFRANTNQANGLRFDRNGDLLLCEGSSGQVSRINLKTKERSILAAQFNGKKLQSPNDLDFDAQGRIYFSSRTNKPDLEKDNVRAVYRVDPDGAIHQLLAEPQIKMPNGLVVSPDGKRLYVIETYPGKEPYRHILAFDLQADGSLANPRILFDFYPGRSGDGMCIDIKGNLYVAAGLHQTRGSAETLDTRPGIYVISPKGKLLAYRETPEDTITNCTFGGEDLKTLYVTCGSYLLSIRSKIPGKSSYRPGQ